LLERRWWQGLAGLAQIGAAFLALLAVWQAEEAQKRANAAMRAAVRPVWHVESGIGLIGDDY
jgi:hypothetical protein